MKLRKGSLIFLTLLTLLLSGCHKSPYIEGGSRVFVGYSIQLTIINPSDDGYTWASSDEEIAAVKNGQISGFTVGEVVISLIKDDKVIATHAIEVLLPPTWSLTGDDFVMVGESVQLGITSSIENDVLSWVSSDDSIATVIDGLAYGIRAGVVEITITSNELVSTSFMFYVLENRIPTWIEPINILDTYIIEEGPYQLEAIAYPHYASQDFYWEVAGSKATIEKESGIITFLEEGLTYVICRSRLDNTVLKVITLSARHDENIDITRVLFVGNSLTYVNDIPKMVQSMARTSGKTIYCDSVTEGGQYIIDAYTNYYQTILNLLNAKQYDYLILQEQSSGSYKQHQRFISGATTFNQLANEYDIKVILYQTWPYKEGSPSMLSQNISQQEMLAKIVEAYQNVANEIGAEINPVGEVFYAFLQAYPDIELYRDDNHASLAGSYLSSCVHYVKLFNESIAGNTYPIGLDSVTINAIQTFVSNYLLSN